MFRLVVWLVSLACSIVSTASAQVETDSPEYTATIHEALAEFEDGHFAEARALFRHAHVLQPSARTLRGLGISAFELREYEDATRKLEDALASRVKPLEGALRSETQQLLERTYGFVGRYELGMQPTFARLLIDGAESELRAGQRLLLSIGHHQLEARAPAYESDKRTLEVAGGEHNELRFTLTKLAIPPVELASVTPPKGAPAAAPREQPRTDRPLFKNPWLWTATGVAVVAVVVTAVALAGRDTRTRERDPVLTGPQVAIVEGLVAAP